jgi:Glycosyl hydrolase family 26
MKKLTVLLSLSLASAVVIGYAMLSANPKHEATASAQQAEDAKCSAKPNDINVPSCGAWWGTYAKPRNGESHLQALKSLENKVERTFDIVRLAYHRWDEVFPNDEQKQASSEGRIIIFNWKPQTVAGVPVNWKSISSGKENDIIDKAAARIKAFDKKVFVVFHHEPENDVGNEYGTAEEYAAAYRYVHDRFGTDNVNNVIWVINYIGNPKFRDIQPTMYPGDNYIDWVAFDRYNGAECKGRKWTNFAELMQEPYDFFASKFPGKPLMIAEYGTVENKDGSPSKADWFNSMKDAMSNNFPKIKAVISFNSDRECEWWIESSQPSKDAYTNTGKQKYFNPVRP